MSVFCSAVQFFESVIKYCKQVTVLSHYVRCMHCCLPLCILLSSISEWKGTECDITQLIVESDRSTSEVL